MLTTFLIYTRQQTELCHWQVSFPKSVEKVLFALFWSYSPVNVMVLYSYMKISKNKNVDSRRFQWFFHLHLPDRWHECKKNSHGWIIGGCTDVLSFSPNKRAVGTQYRLALHDSPVSEYVDILLCARLMLELLQWFKVILLFYVIICINKVVMYDNLESRVVT